MRRKRCASKTNAGVRCPFPAKDGDYCHRHDPAKAEALRVRMTKAARTRQRTRRARGNGHDGPPAATFFAEALSSLVRQVVRAELRAMTEDR